MNPSRDTRRVAQLREEVLREFSSALVELGSTRDPAKASKVLEDLGWAFLHRAQNLRDGDQS